MTINREMKFVKLLSYSSTIDEYGQRKTGAPKELYIEMAIILHLQSETSSPIYNECEAIGLTNFKCINDTNRIQDGDTVYDIIRIIPTGRLTQVLLRKHK